MLVGIEFRNIDIYKAYLRIFESRFGGSGEVAVTGTNPNDQVSFAGEYVRAWRAGNAHRAERLGMIVVQGALSRLGFHHRDANPTDELSQRFRCLTVDDSAPGNDQRRLAGADPICRLAQQFCRGSRTGNNPYAFIKHGGRVIESFNLNVLRE